MTAFVVSNTFSAMPFLIMITFLSGTICYFMVRLHPGFIHYLFFVLGLYASVTVVESLMMSIASVVPNFLMGIIIGAGIQVNNFISFSSKNIKVLSYVSVSNYIEFSMLKIRKNWTGYIHAGFWLLQTPKWHSKASLEVPNVIHQLSLLGITGKK